MPDYRRLRQIAIELNKKFVKSISRDVLNEGGRKLGIPKNGTFVFESEYEMSVLMDFCIHNVPVAETTAVQRCSGACRRHRHQLMPIN